MLRNLVKGLFAASLVMSVNAFACEDGMICPGSVVYPDSYSNGYAEVIAINPATGAVTVKGNYSSSYGRYSTEDLAVASGCLQGVCVGDKVIPTSYSNGYADVIAINAYKKTFTVKGNYSSSYGRYTADSLAVMSGCYRGICVGEHVVPASYSNGYGEVLAIDRASRQFILKGNYSSSYGLYDASQLAREKGCLSGICVGDQVFPDSYQSGYADVIAIDRENRTITVMGNYSASYGRYSPEQVSIIKACEEYGPDERRD